MADRYLRSSGAWSGAVWSAASDGAPGTAGAPGAGDHVYIIANYTVTLTANATCTKLLHINGTINLGTYTLSLVNDGDYNTANFQSPGSTTRTINMQAGTLIIGDSTPTEEHQDFYLGGPSLTFNAGTSLIVFNDTHKWDDIFPSSFHTGNKTFNDVVINLNGAGYTEGISEPFNITGSPTFRSLTIQSKNSAAHTVNFDDGASVYTSMLIAIGSSTANRLRLGTGSTNLINTSLSVASGGTVYGQFINIDGFSAVGATNVPHYIGSNSIQTYSAGSRPWLLQDPPKAHILQDPLATPPASNPNWGVGYGTVNQVTAGLAGGGYSVQNGLLYSIDTYDLLDSSLVFQSVHPYGGVLHLGVSTLGIGTVDPGVFIQTQGSDFSFGFTSILKRLDNTIKSNTINTASFEPSFMRISMLEYGLLVYETYYDDEWHVIDSVIVEPDYIPYFRSVRVLIHGGGDVGSIGMLDVRGYLKARVGSAWVEKPAKVYLTSTHFMEYNVSQYNDALYAPTDLQPAWVEKPIRTWNGSAWV